MVKKKTVAESYREYNMLYFFPLIFLVLGRDAPTDCIQFYNTREASVICTACIEKTVILQHFCFCITHWESMEPGLAQAQIDCLAKTEKTTRDLDKHIFR